MCFSKFLFPGKYVVIKFLYLMLWKIIILYNFAQNYKNKQMILTNANIWLKLTVVFHRYVHVRHKWWYSEVCCMYIFNKVTKPVNILLGIHFLKRINDQDIYCIIMCMRKYKINKFEMFRVCKAMIKAHFLSC